jgi:hypothetical protein
MSQQPYSEIIRLRQNLRENRATISREYSGLVHDLDFRRRFTESVKRHPLGWIGGAVSTGLVAALFRAGNRKRHSVSASVPVTAAPSTLARAGWIAGALEVGRILYPVLQPLLMPLVSDLLVKITRSGLAKRGRLP